MTQSVILQNFSIYAQYLKHQIKPAIYFSTTSQLCLPHLGHEYRLLTHTAISSENAATATPPVTNATQIGRARPVPAKK